MYASLNIADAGLKADQAAFVAALDQAHARSFHSYYTQYVLTDDEAGYIAVDEGDYGRPLPVCEGDGQCGDVVVERFNVS